MHKWINEAAICPQRHFNTPGPTVWSRQWNSSIVPLQEYCEPACLLTQSNEAGTNGYPL